jgi:hypothetical protein
MLVYNEYAANLNKIGQLLTERRKNKWEEGVDYLLVQAAELACSSLKRLLGEDVFWNWIENSENSDKAKEYEFDNIILPVNEDILHNIGYSGPPPARQILIEARQAIENGKIGEYKNRSSEVKGKIENLSNILCGYAGNARGVLSTFPSPPQAADTEKSKTFWVRLNKKVPVRKILHSIGKAVTIISGALTIVLGAREIERWRNEKPDPPPVIIIQQKIENFWTDYYFIGVTDGEDDNEGN